jgi:hypothetical protein
MKQSLEGRPATGRAWRVFSARDGRRIDAGVRLGGTPVCPCCGAVLEARGVSRPAGRLPLGATAVDLDCRPCRRFWTVVRHTERSIRLVRMRRFVAALRAVNPAPTPGVTVIA